MESPETLEELMARKIQEYNEGKLSRHTREEAVEISNKFFDSL